MLKEIIQQLAKEKLTTMINKHIGSNDTLTEKAVNTIVGTILGGLAKNTKTGGADSLAGALDKDHDGSFLDNIGEFSSILQSGDGILKHIYGEKRNQIEQLIANKSGLPQETITQLHDLIAPIVMAKLGKEKIAQHLDTDHLKEVLQKESKQLQQDTDLSSIMSLLDKDGDGDIDIHDFLK